MKKLLLGTTILCGALAMATSAHANGHSSAPSVNIGGTIDFQAGIADQDSAYETGANSRDVKFQNDTEIHVNVEGKTDGGLKYGANIELEADISSDNDGEGLNADKTYIYVESDTGGRGEFGGNTDAAAAMKVDASSIAVATGGIDGDFYDFANIGGSFWISPDLPTAFAAGATEDATKISYYTPRFSGVQFGVSYTPDQGDAGSAAGFTGEANGDQEEVLNLGLNYEGTYNDGLGVRASLTGEFGQSELATTEDLAAWQAGLALSKGGWSIAGSYADMGDSGLLVGSTNDDQNFWTLGAAYETGPYGVSVNYIESEASNNDFNNIVVGADYDLAPGLVPYVEVSIFDTDDNVAGTADNDGSIILVGAELNF